MTTEWVKPDPNADVYETDDREGGRIVVDLSQDGLLVQTIRIASTAKTAEEWRDTFERAVAAAPTEKPG